MFLGQGQVKDIRASSLVINSMYTNSSGTAGVPPAVYKRSFQQRDTPQKFGQLLALSGEKTIAELISEFGVHQTQIHRWVKQLKESATGIFSGEIKTE